MTSKMVHNCGIHTELKSVINILISTALHKPVFTQPASVLIMTFPTFTISTIYLIRTAEKEQHISAHGLFLASSSVPGHLSTVALMHRLDACRLNDPLGAGY